MRPSYASSLRLLAVAGRRTARRAWLRRRDRATAGAWGRDALDHSLARRLLDEAAAAARRLRPLCADWPEDRFGDLAYGAALARLWYEVPPTTYAALRAEVARHRNAYLARLRERASGEAAPASVRV